MEETLITKKELLELTGISYGALYRWKRMKLLPDDWFIRKSTYSGHETFFPREKILKRVSDIQRMKETMSLEDIAQSFQPAEPAKFTLTQREVVASGIAPAPILNQFLAMLGEAVPFDYPNLLRLQVFVSLIRSGKVSREEAMEVADTAVKAIRVESDTVTIMEPMLYLLRKYGVFFCVACGENHPLVFDPDVIEIDHIAVNTYRDQLNDILREKGVMK